MKKPLSMLFITLLAVSFALSGCGKTSKPIAYEGSGYPHSYPQQ